MDVVFGFDGSRDGSVVRGCRTDGGVIRILDQESRVARAEMIAAVRRMVEGARRCQ